MDLSKIPEPTEDDLKWTLEGISDYHGNYEDPQKDLRVIAHLLRHGSVLAAFAKRHGMHRSSVEFFEKFGGNDER